MARIIKIKKGLNINLQGAPADLIGGSVVSDYYAVFPDDFNGLQLKVAVKQGDKVLAGTPVLFDKNRPEIKIVSPVSGEISAVNRGEKRKLLSIVIQADEKNEYESFGKKEVKSLSSEIIKRSLAEAGIMAFIKQRPYDIVANPDDTPRDIFVTGFYSAPLSPDLDFLLKGNEADFQTGLDALSLLTEGKVYLGIGSQTTAACLKNAQNVEIVHFEGPHPAGNVGVQINRIQPVNKGEIVWTIDPVSVVFIGRLFNKGIADFSRLVALTGSEVNMQDRIYYSVFQGINIESIIKGKVTPHIDLRFISGNVLTGTQIAPDGFLHAYDNQITVIPEGNETNEFFGWIMPGFDKFSVSRTYPSFLLKCLTKRKYTMDARIKGSRRAMIMSNEWDKVFPMDILPEFLIRAILVSDVDKMESLGIYEVAPEDFALCEFVDTSKMELQTIVRHGLDWLHKEMS
jgi:Na+-transporting NADH:ubiquinone oxidoreductase subunit A